MKRALPYLLILLCVGGLLRRIEPGATGQLQAVIVEPVTPRSPAVGAVLTDRQLWQFTVANKIPLKVIRADAAGPDLAEIQWALDGIQNNKVVLPALVTHRGDGAAHVGPMPATAKDLIANLKSQM